MSPREVGGADGAQSLDQEFSQDFKGLASFSEGVAMVSGRFSPIVLEQY